MGQNRILSQKKGRIIYVEPTDFPEYKIHENGNISEGVTLDNISWNLEDLQFNIDLRVINPDRRGSKLPIFQGKNNSSESNFTSFMSGKDFGDENNFLTDSYTDITFQEVNTNGESQKESLGIDSIDISFDSHFFPLVTIKFTDVRAAALFGPTDNEYVHNKRIEAIKNNDKLSEEEKAKGISEEKNKMSSSFFKSLFHFPYPRFMLSVMGYYGERVTFQLAVNDFKTSFNSSNGNFDVSVSFIGYMYGLYTDLPMSLVFTAPYYDRKYWNDSIKEGRFKYSDDQPIMTFIDFLEVYYKLQKEENDEGINSSDVLKAYKKLYDAKTSLENILEAFKIFNAQFTTNTNSITVFRKNEKDVNAFLLFSDTTRHELTISKFNNLNDSVIAYNKDFTDNKNNQLSLKVFTDASLNREYVDFNLQTSTLYNAISHTNNKEVDDVIDYLNSIKREVPGIKTSDGTYRQLKYFTYYTGDFQKEVNKRLDVVIKELESRNKEVDEEMMKVIEKKLKFRPTIENVFRMIFAHIDTFIHALKTNVLDNISSSIANGDGKRRSDYLGLTEKNSDLPKNCTGAMTIPPFPLCKDDITGEYKYPGIYFNGSSGNIPYIDEVSFVEKIVEGIKVFNDDASRIKELIENLSIEEDKSFNTVSISDILYKNVNPYISLRDKLEGVPEVDSKKAGYIEYFIFARIIMYAITNGISDKDLKNKIDELVNLEFENFKKANISLSKNTKACLINSGMQYRVGSKVLTYSIQEHKEKENYKFKSNYCYFFNDAFNKDDSDNKFSNTNSSTLVVLDDSYDEAINICEEKNKDEIDTKNTIKSRESWLKTGSKDEYTMSYITTSKEDKSKTGFAGDYYKEKWLLLDMQVDYNRSGEMTLLDYNAGILQIGDNRASYTDGNTEKAYGREYIIDDIYFGINAYREPKSFPNKKDKPVMSVQVNQYFRAFLLLGSLSTYFNLDNDYSLETYYETPAVQYTPKQYYNKEAKLFKHPKVLLLYYGACAYFRKNNHERLNDGTIYKDSFSLINLPIYTTDDAVIKYDNIYKQWILKTFTDKKKNLFLSNSKFEDLLEIKVSNGVIDDLEKYFVNWVDSGEFKKIDDILSSDKDAKTVVMTTGYDTSYHTNKDIIFTQRSASSKEDLDIKKLLCEDVYVYKKPEGLTSDYDIYSYSKEYFEAIKKSFESYKTEEDIKEEERKEEEKKVTDVSEVKKALYYTLKRLYDKWLSCYNIDNAKKSNDSNNDVFKLNTPSGDKDNRKKRYTTNSDDNISTEFNSFIFVDSFYRDISDKFLVDPDTIRQLAEAYSTAAIMDKNASVFEFMNEIAEKNGLLFASLPVYSNFYDVNTIVNIFSPNKKYDVTKSGKSDTPGNTYVIMYTGEASSKLDFGEDAEYDDDGITGIPDIFQSSQDQVPTSVSDLAPLLKSSEDDEINFVVPVFGVTFGKQNQMYFKNITVNMDEPKVTDYSIANLIQISQGGKNGDSEGYNVGIGQDIYSIYANRSYTCTVEMLGCINIMPMMYFQLNNIPMFRGLYIIINVSHSVVPGNMTTKFTGVRVSKNHIGLVRTIFAYQGHLDKVNTDGISLNISENSVTISCENFVDEQFTEHFKLSNFVSSREAGKRGICNMPDSEEIKQRIKELCVEILEPLYKAWYSKTSSGFFLTSGYRNKELNDSIGGASNSAHSIGSAADLYPNNKDIYGFQKFVYKWLKDNNKNYDQYIDEKKGQKLWAHIGYINPHWLEDSNKNKKFRKQNLYYNSSHNPKYWLIPNNDQKYNS